MDTADDPTNYPAGYEQIVGRSAASTAPQLFQINWMRVFGGTMPSIHPQPNVMGGGGASAPADSEPAGTAVTLAQSRAIAGKASSSMGDMLNGRTFTFIGEMKGDGDNCESRNRSAAQSQSQAPEDSKQFGNADMERPPKRPLISSTPTSRAIVPKSLSEQHLGRGGYAFGMDSSPETDVAGESSRSLCSSNLSFKRRYKPMQPNVAPAAEARSPTIERTEAAASERVYDSRVDKILQIMNTAETDYSKHRIRLTTAQSANGDAKHSPAPANRYSYYALFFMVISNIVGVALSLNYQVLLFLKLNADRFLGQSWQHCQNVTLLRTENNIVTLLLMLPLIVVVLLAYVTIWAAYNLNRLLLTTVPDRLAQLINFNIQIVN